jgi:hypothetical protein
LPAELASPEGAVRADVQGAPFTWGLDRLRAALRAYPQAAGTSIRVLAPGAELPGMAMPTAPDSFALIPGDGTLTLWGSTPRGVVYALSELAERVRLAGPGERPLQLDTAVVEQPVGRVRSMARFFCSVEEDRPWLHDEAMWCDYLDTLAANRFTGVTLGFGLQYNYPYYNRLITDTYLYFAYPFLLEVPGYDVTVDGLPEGERARNLAMLRFIGEEAARRGLDFRIGLWTHGYDFDDVPNANYRVRGITAENHASYCRDALRMLVASVPGLTGVTIRVHVEAGVPEGSYDFWGTVFEGLRDPGRPLHFDVHAKGTDQRMIDLALGTGLPVSVSPKFMAEHTGLPYHQAAVRQREMPITGRENTMFTLSEGSRRFLRYGYGDLLATDRQFDVVVRVWPGTQRVLLSADPALAAGYGRAGAFCGAAGIEFFEPLSFKGRMGSGRLGARFNYAPEELRPRHDWSKYTYMFALLGRLSYQPDAAPETWMRPLRDLAGDAAEGCARALAAASRVLPLFTNAHGVSACNNTYWPELYDNMSMVYAPAEYPYGYDSDGATRFGDVPTFDPQLFATPAEFVAALHEGRALAKYGPLDVARWLDALAEESDAGTRMAEAARDARRPEVVRMLVDARMQARLGRFFAARLRSACAFELYLLTGLRDAYLDAADDYRRARDAWHAVVQAAEGVYQDDLSYGPQPWLRGHWRDRLGAIDRDIEDLEFWYINDRDRHPDDPARAAASLARMRGWAGTASGPLAGKVPAWFTRGEPLEVRLDAPGGGAARLHFRRVNQSETWDSVAMERRNGAVVASIPAETTDTVFPLQFYMSLEEDGRVVLAPGLAEDLCSVPYAVAMPDRGSAA